jgi:CDP-diacylglycerol--glycerol-3-phosphate 3-phosphatidyltransferase
MHPALQPETRVNLPNLLTLSRVPAVFVIAALLYVPAGWAAWLALTVFVVAALTDWADGWAARKQGIVTNFGKLMDALCDKILTVGLFVVLLVAEITADWTLVYVLIILSREFFVTGLRLVAVSRGTVLAAEAAGKVKTATQILAIALFLLSFAMVRQASPELLSGGALQFERVVNALGLAFYTVAALLTLYSGLSYTVKYRGLIMDKEA